MFRHQSGLVKTVKLGYSWKMFWLGPICPFLDGYNKLGIMLILINIVIVIISFSEFTFIYGNILDIILGFFYNKWYVKFILTEGFEPKEEERILVNKYLQMEVFE